MSGERACSNPLCEHFRLMVPEGRDFFAVRLKESSVSRAPSSELVKPEDLTYRVRHLGRKVWKWIVDRHSDLPGPWCAYVETYFAYDRGEYIRKEWYYFCDDCNEVLEKAS